LIGIDVNQFHHPIDIGSGRRRHQIRYRLAADGNRGIERSAAVSQDVGASRELSLIIYQPARPRQRWFVTNRLTGPRAEWNGLGGIRYVFVVCGSPRWRLESQ